MRSAEKAVPLTSAYSVVCLLPQAQFNNFRSCAQGNVFHSLLCLGAQRKGMVISMLAAKGISFFPYPSRYAVRYEGDSPYTAMEFAKQIKKHSLAELLSMQLLPYEILEIDDGIRPYCFLVERLGHVRCIRFKSDIARESKYEESGGKAI